jgi:hypothetical protein
VKLFTAFLCGLFLGMSSVLWHLFYWAIIVGLLIYIAHLHHV